MKCVPECRECFLFMFHNENAKYKRRFNMHKVKCLEATPKKSKTRRKHDCNYIKFISVCITVVHVSFPQVFNHMIDKNEIPAPTGLQVSDRPDCSGLTWHFHPPYRNTSESMKGALLWLKSQSNVCNSNNELHLYRTWVKTTQASTWTMKQSVDFVAWQRNPLRLHFVKTVIRCSLKTEGEINTWAQITWLITECWHYRSMWATWVL